MSIQLRLKCDDCGMSMRARGDENVISLRDRAGHAGWRHSWNTNYRDLCNVCAPKAGAK